MHLHLFGDFPYDCDFYAQNIIGRLAEHRMQLPDAFGSYKLIDWNVMPPSKRLVFFNGEMSYTWKLIPSLDMHIMYIHICNYATNGSI